MAKKDTGIKPLVKKRGIYGSAPGISGDENTHELSLFDTGNPKAVVNLLPKKIADAMELIRPNLLSNSLAGAERSKEIGEIESLLRLAFWDEYFVACDRGGKMIMERVYSRVCSKEYFYKYVVPNQTKLAYILHPPKEYTLKMRELLEMGHERIREILQLPLRQGNRVDAKLISEIVKIVTLLENRVRGAVVHRVELNQKSLNVNVDYEPPSDYFEVEAELKMLDEQLKGMNDTTIEVAGGQEGVIEIEAEAAPVAQGETEF